MMKNFLCLLLLSYGNTLFGQIYNYEVGFASGILFKAKGSFEITDSTVITRAWVGEEEKIQKFTRKPSTNDAAIYYTDGVQTFMLNIQPQTGKKKGYEHEYMIVLSNLNTPNNYFTYYGNKQK